MLVSAVLWQKEINEGKNEGPTTPQFDPGLMQMLSLNIYILFIAEDSSRM